MGHDTVRQACEAGAVLWPCAANAVVGHAHHHAAVPSPDAQHHLAGLGVLHRVGESFAGDEVGSSLELGREPLGGGLHLDGQRGSPSELPQRRAEASIEQGRAHPASELAELVDRRGDLGQRSFDRPLDLWVAFRAELVLGMAQCQSDRDEPLLRAVVEITFDAPSFVVSDRNEARP